MDRSWLSCFWCMFSGKKDRSSQMQVCRLLGYVGGEKTMPSALGWQMLCSMILVVVSGQKCSNFFANHKSAFAPVVDNVSGSDNIAKQLLQ